MSLKNKNFGFQVKEIKEDGIFEGYASVFDVEDSYGDVVLPGAFKDSLENKKPKILWQHMSAEPIGVPLETKEDEKGLFIRGQLAMKTVRGAEAYELLKMGAIDGMSIGYMSLVETYDKEKNLLFLEKIDLWEFSLVTFPACETAKVSFVKSIDEIGSLADAEDLLRESGGFSKGQACAVVSKIKAIGWREATLKAEIMALAVKNEKLINP